MNFSTSFSQELSLSRGYGGTVFEKTRQEVEAESLTDMLDEQAKRHNFETGMDWLLCRLYPQYEQDCRLFYAGKGKSFNEQHGKMVRHVDAVMATCLRESSKRASGRNNSRILAGFW